MPMGLVKRMLGFFSTQANALRAESSAFTAREGIHAADVGTEEIFGIG